MADLIGKISIQLNNIGLICTIDQIEKFNEYLNLLNKWNKAFNLTAVRDINEMLDRHLVDSLSIAKYIKGNRLLDVGTGPGLPGIPLSILYPDKTFYLLDSNGKKTRFLKQCKMELDLHNVEIVNTRVEEYYPDELFDAILSRAFSNLQDMIEGTKHLCKKEGAFYAMKGQYPEMELQAISKPYNVQAIDWPGNQVERHLIIISQAQ